MEKDCTRTHTKKKNTPRSSWNPPILSRKEGGWTDYSGLYRHVCLLIYAVYYSSFHLAITISPHLSTPSPYPSLPLSFSPCLSVYLSSTFSPYPFTFLVILFTIFSCKLLFLVLLRSRIYNIVIMSLKQIIRMLKFGKCYY